MTRPGNRAAALVVSARSWPLPIPNHGLRLRSGGKQRRDRFDESSPVKRELDAPRESEPVLRTGEDLIELTRLGKEES